MSDVLQQRQEIEDRIAGMTFCTRLERTVAERGDAPAYSDKIGLAAGEQGWRTLSWTQVREHALDLAAGLAQIGLAPGDTMAIMATNRIEHVLADIAAVHASGTPMSIYATFAPEQVAYVAGNAEPTVVVLEGADQLQRWQKALDEVTSIKAVVVMDAALAGEDDRAVSWDDLLERGREARAADPVMYDDLWRSVTPDHPLTILYTSGTTGHPKGVVLTHHNICFETESSLDTHQLWEPGETVSYLPFAHIAERMLGIYIPQFQGGHVHLIGDPALLVGALGEVHPTRFFGVPRVWEKIRTGVSGLLAAETDEAKKAAVEKAMEVGLRYVESRQLGQETSPELAEEYAAMDAAVLGPIRGLLGLDRVEWAASAAAPMPVEVTRFFAGLGIAIYDAGIISNQPADTHVHRFEEEAVTPQDDVLSVGDKFLKYFQDNFPGAAVGYHIAGYRTENRASVPYVLVGHTIREPGLRRVNADDGGNIQYGITRAGDTLIANRLIDQSYLPLFIAMPLQDAVDYAVHLIRTTIDTMRFEPRFPSVGGPIDVLVVTPAGLEWVQRKKLRGPD